ncbi:hypothetical protein FRB93_000629 [Tulasnella sp. JGI-2019a]|nr:hypothetical protein FRB93_000629 [Tulasnella sp. JGI-2019a]
MIQAIGQWGTDGSHLGCYASSLQSRTSPIPPKDEQPDLSHWVVKVHNSLTIKAHSSGFYVDQQIPHSRTRAVQLYSPQQTSRPIDLWEDRRYRFIR